VVCQLLNVIHITVSANSPISVCNRMKGMDMSLSIGAKVRRGYFPTMSMGTVMVFGGMQAVKSQAW
jgi:hypothetical protein